MTAAVHYVVIPSFLLLMSLVQGQQSFSKSVSNILNSVQDAVGYIEDYVGGKKGCIFECPYGSKPRVNPYHQPTSNGCGSFGFKLEDYVTVKDLTKCCNNHDHCYDTCNNEKDACDRIFKKCLEKICMKIRKKTKLDELYEGCMSTADVIFASTVALGCKPYKDAQAKACQCARPRSRQLGDL